MSTPRAPQDQLSHDIAALIVKHRKQLGLGQSQLAVSVGLSGTSASGSLGVWEQARGSFLVSHLNGLCQTLGLEFAEELGDACYRAALRGLEQERDEALAKARRAADKLKANPERRPYPSAS